MTNYLILVPAAFGILGTFLALYYKSRATSAETTAIVSQVQAKDAPLAAQQAQDQAGIAATDKGIKDMMVERDKLRNQYVTDQQKADSWNNPTPPAKS